MSKLNTKAKSARIHTKIKNHEGDTAFMSSAEMGLYKSVCASFLEDTFYETANARLQRIQDLAAECDPVFVLKLAAYARNDMKLRTIPQILVAEATKADTRGKLRGYVPKVVLRADEPMELLSYWIKHIGGGNKKGMPTALKRGLGDALNNWNEYQLAKYNRTKYDVKLKDVLRIVHPKPHNKEQEKLFGKIINDDLNKPDTWEVLISTKGASQETWNEIAPKMPIFALLRNLRNFEKHNAHVGIDCAIKAFTNKDQVLNSRILPFRWYVAMKHCSSSKLQNALRDALDISVANIPHWEGTTAICVDHSYSMYDRVSSKSELKCKEVGDLLCAMSLHFSDEAEIYAFGSTSVRAKGFTSRDSILSNADRLSKINVGCATYAHLPVLDLLGRKVKVDRIVMLSDMQTYRCEYSPTTLRSAFKDYLKFSPETKLYTLDLRGYNRDPFSESDKNVLELTGWSENIFKLVPYLEKANSVVDIIKEKW